MARELLGRNDSGGTELGVTVEQALDQSIIDDEAVKHVVMVTDVEVSDAARIVQTLTEKRVERKCSVICIDSAPNSHMAKMIARVGEGTAKFLTSSPEEKDLATALDDIMEEWAAPMATDVHIITDRPAYDSERGRYKEDANGKSVMRVPSVPSGRSILMLGSFKTKGKTDLSFHITDQDGKTEEVQIANAEDQFSGLEKLYGSAMVNMLEILAGSETDLASICEGLKPFDLKLGKVQAQRKIYRENSQADIKTLMKGILVKTSLHYGVPSSETAFLGIRKEEGKAATKPAIVLNAVPDGWSANFAHDVGGNQLNMLCRYDTNSLPVTCGGMAPPQPNERDGPLVDIDLPKGFPLSQNGELVLLDTAAEPAGKMFGLMSPVTITGKALEGAELQIFVGNLSSVRVRMRLRDMRSGFLERPINVQVGIWERVMIKLVGLDGKTHGSPLKVVIT